MYSGEIDNEKVNVSLLAAADMYEIMGLRNKCIHVLSKSIKSDNVREIWEAGFLFDIDDLVFTSTRFLAQNWAKLSKEDDIIELCEKYPKLLFTISILLVERFRMKDFAEGFDLEQFYT